MVFCKFQDKIGCMPNTVNSDTTKLLIEEIGKIDADEQNFLFRQLKIRAWLSAGPKPVVTYKKGSKPMSMSQIDAIKHKGRGEYADK